MGLQRNEEARLGISRKEVTETAPQLAKLNFKMPRLNGAFTFYAENLGSVTEVFLYFTHY